MIDESSYATVKINVAPRPTNSLDDESQNSKMKEASSETRNPEKIMIDRLPQTYGNNVTVTEKVKKNN